MNLRPIIIVSLVLNVALGGFILLRQKDFTPQRFPVENMPVRPGPMVFSKTAVLTNITGQKFDWRQVESEDYKKYIANLRAVGCPEETIRDIIIADINKMFEDRKRTLKKSVEPFKFWETGRNSVMRMMGGAIDEETIKANQALAAEKRALIKELLDIEIDAKPDLMAGTNPFESILDFLSTDKQTKIFELQQQFRARTRKALGEGTQDEHMEMLLKVQKDMENEIAAILTPQEFENYQLRMSATSTTMRMQLGDFNPSEKEFRDVFKLQKTFDDEFGPVLTGNMHSDQTGKWMTAQEELDKKIKATLGDARYADYQREKDWDYKNIVKAADRQGLPKEAARKVYDMKKAATEQADRVRKDNSLSTEQRAAALRAIRTETKTAMIQVLGQKGFDSYKNQAYWLNNISGEPGDSGQ